MKSKENVKGEIDKKMGALKDGVIDINLSGIKKKRFRINEDDSRILELNTSDFGIVSRYEESIQKLKNLGTKVSEFSESIPEDEDGLTEDAFSSIAKTLKEIDTEMREIIDYIFDSNVSEVCGKEGTMYDIVEGKYRYEHIADTLFSLYEDAFRSEKRRVDKQIKAHTDKYTG